MTGINLEMPDLHSRIANSPPTLLTMPMIAMTTMIPSIQVHPGKSITTASIKTAMVLRIMTQMVAKIYPKMMMMMQILSSIHWINVRQIHLGRTGRVIQALTTTEMDARTTAKTQMMIMTSVLMMRMHVKPA